MSNQYIDFTQVLNFIQTKMKTIQLPIVGMKANFINTKLLLSLAITLLLATGNDLFAQTWDPSGASSSDPIYRSNYVGLYNTDPQYDLDLGASDYNNSLIIRYSTKKNNSQLIKYDFDGNNELTLGAYNTGADFRLYKSANPLFGTHNSEFGFFTTSPLAKFHASLGQNEQFVIGAGGSVKSLVTTPGYYGNSGTAISSISGYSSGGGGSGSNLFLNPEGGYVGVNTNVPSSNLHVKGPSGGSGFITIEDGSYNSYGRMGIIGKGNNIMVFANDGSPNGTTGSGSTIKDFYFLSKWDGTRSMDARINIFPSGTSSFNGALSLGAFSNYTYISGGAQLYLEATNGIVFGTPTTTNQNLTSGAYRVAVDGKLGAREVWCSTAIVWPDYVFDNSYKLPSLDSVANFVQVNKHLPNVPSAKEVEKSGFSLGEMDATLLKKVEELTLYLIELKKQNELLQSRIIKLESKEGK